MQLILWRHAEAEDGKPDLERRLTEKGVVVYAVREDARDRGLDPGRVIGGVEFIARGDMADIVEKYDQTFASQLGSALEGDRISNVEVVDLRINPSTTRS